MSKQELADRVATLESKNRRFRSVVSVTGVVLLVLVGVGWAGGSHAERAEGPGDVRARSIVLVDASGEPAVRMRAQEGGLRVSMLQSGRPAIARPEASRLDSLRVRVSGSSAVSVSSLVLHPSTGLALYGADGRPVARLGRVEATELVR